MSGSLRPVSGSTAQILHLLREWDAAPAPEPLVIETSGSTGRPKRVVLSRDAMRASALATHERLGGPGQWVLNLPPTWVAGVQVLYRCVVAGTEPVPFAGSFRATREQITGRSYVSLVATQLARQLHRAAEQTPRRRTPRGRGRLPSLPGHHDAAPPDRGDPDIAWLAEFDAVLIGGGPLDPRVRAGAEARGVRIVQTYGMSETCGGCVYDGVGLDGVRVRIGEGPEAGQVLLRGPMLFDGYEGEPERTARALAGGWFHTDDLGSIDADGRLRVEGRADDVIISGGVKVPARAVAGMLARDGAVQEVEVVGVPDPEWGERVVAVVELSAAVTLAALRDLVEPRAWAPRQLVPVERVPRLANGKPDREAMRRLAEREAVR